jgi:hypothetical protein
MKDKKLLVRVSCTNRFYIFKRKGRADFEIKFHPPAIVRNAGIDRVCRTTHHALEAPARESAKQIIEEYFPDKDGRIAVLADAAVKARGDYALLPEFVERYRTGARTIENKENVRQATVQHNICQFIKIVETRFDAHGKRSRKAGSWETTRVDAALPDLWTEFKLGSIRASIRTIARRWIAPSGPLTQSWRARGRFY